jgi:hypothetical protein
MTAHDASGGIRPGSVSQGFLYEEMAAAIGKRTQRRLENQLSPPAHKEQQSSAAIIRERQWPPAEASGTPVEERPAESTDDLAQNGARRDWFLD